MSEWDRARSHAEYLEARKVMCATRYCDDMFERVMPVAWFGYVRAHEAVAQFFVSLVHEAELRAKHLPTRPSHD